MAKCINGIPSREERESGQSWIDYEEMAEMQNFSASECRDVAKIGKTNANDREKMVETRNKRSMTTAKDVQHFSNKRSKRNRAVVLRHSWPIRDKVAQRAANGSFSTVQVSEVPSYEGI